MTINKIFLLADKFENKLSLTKRASVQELTALLSRYPSTTELLRDLAKAQFTIADLDPNAPDKQKDDAWMASKAMHDAIMGFANEFSNLEADFL